MFRGSRELELSLSADQHLTIIPFGDVHYPSENTDIYALKSFVSEVKNMPDTVYLIGMGDFWDCILPNQLEKRMDASVPYTPLKKAKQDFLDIISPLSKRILFACTGNHEQKLVQRGNDDPTEWLCKELNVPYMGYSAFFDLTIRKASNTGHRNKSSTLPFYTNHGWFSGRQKGAKINAMENASSSFSASMYIYAHSHDLITSKRALLSINGAEIRCFVNSGSFFKTCQWNTTSYAEMRGFPPTVAGNLVQIKWYPFMEKENHSVLRKYIMLEM